MEMGAAKRGRLEILEASLQKKEAKFDEKLGAHFASVKQANGQPLNDKRNGAATVRMWERQNDSLRTINEGIERTKAAIEKEKNAIALVECYRDEIPGFITEMVQAGELVQWRKHPNFFFVPGVEKGRIVWHDDTQSITNRYAQAIPDKEQYAIFVATWNKLRDASIKAKEASQS